MLEDQGWITAITEKWNQWAKVRVDLWGFGDIIAFRDDEVMIVQTTSYANVSTRVNKIAKIPEAREWCNSEFRKLHVHGWKKVISKGQKKHWECRIVNIQFE